MVAGRSPQAERRQTVWTWRFTAAIPAADRFAPLAAESGEVVDEITELAFTLSVVPPAVTQSSRTRRSRPES